MGGAFRGLLLSSRGGPRLPYLPFSHPFCWPSGGSRPPKSGIVALTFSCSVPRWPPNPSLSCCFLLGSHCPLCTLPSLSVPPAQALPAHFPPVSSFLWAFHHRRTHRLSRMSTGHHQVVLSEAGGRGLEHSWRYHTQASLSVDFPEASRGPSPFLSSSAPH